MRTLILSIILLINPVNACFIRTDTPNIISVPNFFWDDFQLKDKDKDKDKNNKDKDYSNKDYSNKDCEVITVPEPDASMLGFFLLVYLINFRNRRM